jgi:chemotaxis protein CheX
LAEIDTDIEDVIKTIWASLFELPLDLGGAGQLGPGPLVTGRVQIVGAWDGAVMLVCPAPLACTLAQQMFRADSPPTVDEVRDALGELTNMIAGNVKALLPGPSQIVLPVVTVGSDDHVNVLDNSAVTTVAFTCDGQPLLVTLLRGSADTVGATA